MKKEHKEFLLLHLQDVISDYNSSIDRRTKLLNNIRNQYNFPVEKRTECSHTIAVLLSDVQIIEKCIEEIKIL